MYSERIQQLFSITSEQLFSKSKKRDLVDARFLLYYLCFKRPMQINYIQKYMTDSGYAIQHSSVIHGISVIEDRIKTDKDYSLTINKIK
jgi:chromosomal replication initiation ATPase DnaA